MIIVEEAGGRAAKRRFVELPYFLFRDEPRWSPPLIAVERARFDRHLGPALAESEDFTFLLARDCGTPVGRLALRIDGAGAGHADAFATVDDEAVAAALVEAADGWFAERGMVRWRGPLTLVEGFDVAGATGREWHPPWYAAHLTAAGLVESERALTWRVAAAAGPALEAIRMPPSTPAGRYADPRLALPGITAVPDLTPARGSTRELVRRAKRGEWRTAVVVTVDGDPAALVPPLLGAAHAAGYADVVVPWSPDPAAPPETAHARFSRQ